jgi:hypothetical protein
MKKLVVCTFAFLTPIWGAEIHFNRDIRPILSDRCFACHGPDKGNRKSLLRLDQEDSAKADLGKGRFGIVPGDPARSEVYKRVTSANKTLRMPPQYAGHDRLSDHDIELLKQWIEQGGKYEGHWSRIPPVKPPIPQVAQKEWVRNPIDAFVLSRLEANGLKPSPEASKTTLLRRVSFDLTGLPPSVAEVDAFVHDSSPDAYEKAVDRLLASARYAERMAIRWLEAARYSDTNGYQTDGPRDMWRWRDWVIDSFRSNMPFDQFTIEQLAGDLLPNATLSQRIATGFNRNHRTSAEGGIVDEEFRVEYVADRTETTATVWLGMTVGCARCHDHKYDPILQKEYYQLFAFYNNVPEKGFVYNFGNEEPYIKAPLPDQQRELDRFDAAIAKADERLQKLQPDSEKAFAKWRKKAAKGGHLDWTVTAGQEFRKPESKHFDGKDFIDGGKEIAKFNYRDPFTFAAWITPEAKSGAILSKSEDYFEGTGHGLYLIDGKLRLHVIFRWTDLGMRVETRDPLPLGKKQHVMATYDGSMKASGVHLYVDGKELPLKILFDQCIWPIESKEPFRIGAGGGLRFQGAIEDVRVYRRAVTAEEASVIPLLESVNEIARLSSLNPAQESKLRLRFLETSAPKKVRAAMDELNALRAQKARYLEKVPTVMVMQERKVRRPSFLLKRGAYDAPGEPVEPGVPDSLPPMKPEWPNNRLGLARWVVDRGNPLTARVQVNRYWQMLFGTGLVKTVEDFGSQGEWPMQAELLDWLAVEFMDSGWDVKHILKTIVMSNTYRQSSKVTPELLKADPENRMFARGPRIRLSHEMVRDQALAVSGLLVEKIGGPSVKPYQPPGLWNELQGGKDYQPDKGEGLYRRTLYSYWKRTVAPPNMINFDSPTRETCVVRETRTNTPLQALNLMNDVLFVEASRKLAEDVLASKSKDPTEDIFRRVLGREPSQVERNATEKALGRFEEFYRANPSQAAEFLKQGDSPVSKTVDPVQLAAYAGVASLVLNLDEAVTKE